jgi:hypothetical protein
LLVKKDSRDSSVVDFLGGNYAQKRRSCYAVIFGIEILGF